jgi:hypothetical protein
MGKAHAHYFSTIKLVATMLHVSKLMYADLFVEIEMTALID